jgi:hypothetical protein
MGCRVMVTTPANETVPDEEDEDDEPESTPCPDDEHDWERTGFVAGDVRCVIPGCGVEDLLVDASAWPEDARW